MKNYKLLLFIVFLCVSCAVIDSKKHLIKGNWLVLKEENINKIESDIVSELIPIDTALLKLLNKKGSKPLNISNNIQSNNDTIKHINTDNTFKNYNEFFTFTNDYIYIYRFGIGKKYKYYIEGNYIIIENQKKYTISYFEKNKMIIIDENGRLFDLKKTTNNLNDIQLIN